MSSSRDSADQQGQRLKKARSSSYLGSCKAQQLLQEQAWLALLSGYIPQSPHRLIELKREKERKRRKMRERLNNRGRGVPSELTAAQSQPALPRLLTETRCCRVTQFQARLSQKRNLRCCPFQLGCSRVGKLASWPKTCVLLGLEQAHRSQIFMLEEQLDLPLVSKINGNINWHHLHFDFLL